MTSWRKNGVVKQLSNMTIDEISMVDRGANQHALISIAKRMQPVGKSDHSLKTFTGSDPAGVLNGDDAKRDIGPGGKIAGTQKIAGKVWPPAGCEHTDAAECDCDETESEETVNNSADDDIKLAKSLGLYVDEDYDTDEDTDDVTYYEIDADAEIPEGYELVDDEELGKAFGQQSMMPPQFGQPPAMQSVGAQPMGLGAPQQPPAMGAPAMGAPPMGAPAPGMPGAPMGMAPQLPPDVAAYIQSLEQQLAALQNKDNPEGQDTSSSGGDSGDSKNKNPFGKAYQGDDEMDSNAFLEELSKSLTAEDNREVVAKVEAQLSRYQSQISKAEARITQAEEIAKSERDLRLEREFVSKAAEYNLPVDADELGPVLKRAAESLSLEDFSVLVKCLDAGSSAETMLYGEVGKQGGGSNLDIFDQVNAQAEEILKSNAGITPEQATTMVMDSYPDAYDEYMRNKRSSGF